MSTPNLSTLPPLPTDGALSHAKAPSKTRSRSKTPSRTPSSNTATENTPIITVPNANTTRRKKIMYSLAALAGIGALYLYSRDPVVAKQLATDAAPAFSGIDVDDARAMYRELAQGRTIDLSGAVSKIKGLLSMKGGKRRSTKKNKRRSH
jgi:hypothetical protein